MPENHVTPEAEQPVLILQNVVQEFVVNRRGSFRKARVSAVADVSLSINRGEALAIVGETGSGKTTIARTILRAPRPRSGRVVVAGRDVAGRRRAAGRKFGRLVQMIFQDPNSALDPTWSVERIVAEPLVTAGGTSRSERKRLIIEALDRVGLHYDTHASRRPAELSGGQQQRVAIARALISRPALVICDEPVTALDAATQAQVVELLGELKREFKLTYLVISHDLAVVQQLADRVATMYLGKICEEAPVEELFRHPAHPYTAALLSATPTFTETGRPRLRLLGEPPSPIDPPSGCRFRTRCAFAQDVCAEVEPIKREISPGHSLACHFPLGPDGQPLSTEPDRRASARGGETSTLTELFPVGRATGDRYTASMMAKLDGET